MTSQSIEGFVKFGYYKNFVPSLQWPLLIYEIPISTVLCFEQKISSYLRKWLSINRSTSNGCLCSSISPCQFPIKKLSILKSSRVSGQLLLRDSFESNLPANIEITAGKWSASEAVKDAESRLKFARILCYHQNIWARVRSITTQKISPKNTQDYRKLISYLHAKSVQLSLQGQWTKLCDYIKLDLSWKNL